MLKRISSQLVRSSGVTDLTSAHVKVEQKRSQTFLVGHAVLYFPLILFSETFGGHAEGVTTAIWAGPWLLLQHHPRDLRASLAPNRGRQVSVTFLSRESRLLVYGRDTRRPLTFDSGCLLSAFSSTCLFQWLTQIMLRLSQESQAFDSKQLPPVPPA